jgi:hypothetical protein
MAKFTPTSKKDGGNEPQSWVVALRRSLRRIESTISITISASTRDMAKWIASDQMPGWRIISVAGVEP